MTTYAPTIGIETHAQLLTASKMFCPCSTEYNAAAPNSFVCPVCLGMPGSLPVINHRAVEYVIMTGMALNCSIAEFTKFDRKNYSYPDLVKGYQISQYDLPLCANGSIEIQVGQATHRIGIRRVHLEEDTGKLIHAGGKSLIDFNRSGIPLMEIVTEPDFVSVEEVSAYILKLRQILRYLGVSSGDMETGAMRFEANVSIHPVDTPQLGTRVEVKNLNSFKAVLRSLEYEIERQTAALNSGTQLVQETRGWSEDKGITFVQRSKEEAHDYRYFPEPDLPPLTIDCAWTEELRAEMPELPDARLDRFITQYGLSRYDATVLTEDRATADYYEQAVRAGETLGVEPKAIANWITGQLFYLLKEANAEIGAAQVKPQQLADLVALVNRNAINANSGKHVLEVMFRSGGNAADIVAVEGLGQISDQDEINRIVDEVISANADVVQQYQGGKTSVLRYLVGQVMKASRGKANPKLAGELLECKLNS